MHLLLVNENEFCTSNPAYSRTVLILNIHKTLSEIYAQIGGQVKSGDHHMASILIQLITGNKSS